MIDFSLYLISDGDEVQAHRIERALAALPRGSTAIQLRARGLDGRSFFERALRLREITRSHKAPLLVNDRIDVALAVGAEGVHLPTHGLPVKVARRISSTLWIGASTHSLPEARMAVAGGAHFITLGPVWSTMSHPETVPVGLGALSLVVTLPVPVFALGGIDADRATEVLRLGARIASLGAILGSIDAAAAAHPFALTLAKENTR